MTELVPLLIVIGGLVFIQISCVIFLSSVLDGKCVLRIVSFLLKARSWNSFPAKSFLLTLKFSDLNGD